MHIRLTFYLTSVEPFILHCCATIKSNFHFSVWLQAQTVNSCRHCCNILMVSRCWCSTISQSQIKSCKIKNDNYRPAACMLLLSLLCNNGEGKILWSVPTPKESRNIFGVGKLSSDVTVSGLLSNGWLSLQWLAPQGGWLPIFKIQLKAFVIERADSQKICTHCAKLR